MGRGVVAEDDKAAGVLALGEVLRRRTIWRPACLLGRMEAAIVARRKPSLLLVAVAGLSSSSSGPPLGGKRRKGQRRGEAKPQPQPLPGRSEIPSSSKKPSARSARDRKARPAAEEGQGPTGQEIELRKQQPEKPKRVVRWWCATGCGACCKLDKGPEFPTPDEIFADCPDHLQLYNSMIGPDGWCTNYDKSNRTCDIYEEFFGVPRNKFDREACSACVDNIKMGYGQDSPELGNFKQVIREESSKHEASMNQVKLLDTTYTGT